MELPWKKACRVQGSENARGRRTERRKLRWMLRRPGSVVVEPNALAA